MFNDIPFFNTHTHTHTHITQVEQYTELNGEYSVPSETPAPPQPSSVIQEPTTTQSNTVKKEEPGSERTLTSKAEGSEDGEKVDVTKVASEQIIVQEENVAMEMGGERGESAKASASRTGSPTQAVEKEREEGKTTTDSVLTPAESTSKENVTDKNRKEEEEEEEESVGSKKEEKGGQGEETMEVEASATAAGGESMETGAGTEKTTKERVETKSEGK